MELYDQLIDCIKKCTDTNPVDFDDRFIPDVKIAEKNGHQYWKMEELPFLELTADAIDGILKLVPTYAITEQDFRGVYTIFHITDGRAVRISCNTTNKWYYFYIFLSHKYVIPCGVRVDESDRKLRLWERSDYNLGAGSRAMQQLNNDLRNDFEIVGFKGTITQSLVPESRKSIIDVLKMCVPNQIGWADIQRTQTKLKHCYKADVSSAFPRQLQKSIPTLKGSKIYLDKHVEPTEDYPFVFTYYNGSCYGRVEIYNELDTDVDNKSMYMSRVNEQYKTSDTRLQYLTGEYKRDSKSKPIKINLHPVYRGKCADEFICIACPAAPFTLKKVMDIHYNNKLLAEENGDYDVRQFEKMFMNALIGFMQQNGTGTLPFISAVVIARQNHRMVEMCKSLVLDGNSPIYIATDCIIWIGFENDIATRDKYIGSFTYEYENCEVYMIDVGSYQVRYNGRTYTTCQYLPNGPDKDNLMFGKLPLPKNKLK